MHKTSAAIVIILFTSLLLGWGCQGSKLVQKDIQEVDAKKDKHGYIDNFDEIAVKEMHRTGIPASITLAQGILESGYGNSTLAKDANNHFGIKCNENWEGPRVYMDDDHKNDCFRKYKNPNRSYHDHSKYLTSRSRYEHLFDLPQTAYKRWARGLERAGYATNPTYSKQLIKLIEKYQLYKYDRIKPDETGGENKVVSLQDKNEKSEDRQQATNSTDFHPPENRIYEYNRIRTLILPKSTKPAQITKKYNIPLKRLLKYNNFKKNQQLSAGEKVYLQPKRNHNPITDYHFVQAGETMQDISQRYGIKLRLLYKRNLISSPAQPHPGTKLYLNHTREKPITTLQQSKNNIPPTTSKANNGKRQYTVKKGDTLYSIAEMFKITVDKLKQANQLKSSNISPGDQLIIPSNSD